MQEQPPPTTSTHPTESPSVIQDPLPAPSSSSGGNQLLFPDQDGARPWPPGLYALPDEPLASNGRGANGVSLGSANGSTSHQNERSGQIEQGGRGFWRRSDSRSEPKVDDGTSPFPAQTFAWLDNKPEPPYLPLNRHSPHSQDHQYSPQPSNSVYLAPTSTQALSGPAPDQPSSSFYAPSLPPPSNFDIPLVEQEVGDVSPGSGLIVQPSSLNEAIETSTNGLRALGMDEGGAPYVHIVDKSLEEVSHRGQEQRLDVAMSSRLPLAAQEPAPRQTPPYSAPHSVTSQHPFPSVQYLPFGHRRRQSDVTDYRSAPSSFPPYHQPYTASPQLYQHPTHQTSSNNYYPPRPSTNNGGPQYRPPSAFNSPPILPQLSSSSSHFPPPFAPLTFPPPSKYSANASIPYQPRTSNSPSAPVSTTSPASTGESSSTTSSGTAAVAGTQAHPTSQFPASSSSVKKPIAKRTPIACQRCRAHKLRCLGGQPCAGCAKRNVGDSCSYVAEIKRRGKGKARAGAATTTAAATGSSSAKKGGATGTEQPRASTSTSPKPAGIGRKSEEDDPMLGTTAMPLATVPPSGPVAARFKDVDMDDELEEEEKEEPHGRDDGTGGVSKRWAEAVVG